MAAKRRAEKIKEAKEHGNEVTMSMLGMKNLINCKVDVVSTEGWLAESLQEVFYDAGAENVEKKEK